MHSPFRSESDVFRGAVLIGLGIAVSVAIGAVTEPELGAVLAGVLIGVAIGLALRAGRGSLPEDVENAAPAGDGDRILVIANQTVTGAELMSAIANRASGREKLELRVICPALTRSRLELIASDTDQARAEAEARLGSSLEALRATGLRASGQIGDEDPIQATADALRESGADEMIVSTHPPSQSRWLERGVVEQLRDRFRLPLTHVVVEGAGAESPAA
jgi:GABA permease